MLNNHIEGEWTQGADGEWRQDAPETRWRTLEESAAILKAIFPNYPSLDPSVPHDGEEEQERERALPTVA